MKRIIAALSLALYAALSLGATLNPVQLLNPTGSTAGQAIISAGATAAPGWGNVTATALAAQAANTVLANITASSAPPTAVAIPTCNTSTSALQYAPVTGWTCYASSATTTGTLAQFAATTSAQLAGVLSDETGTGAAVFGTSPVIGTPAISGGTVSGATINNTTLGLTTPLAAKVTTLQATGLITPTSTIGIAGTATNDSPAAGSIGEVQTGSTASTSLTTVTPANCASVPLTAGNWAVSGVITYTAAGSTTISSFANGISTTSAAFGAANTGSYTQQTATFTTGNINAWSTPVVFIKLASSGTAYLVGQAGFGVSTMTCAGFISAQRIR
ncbi:MULTISPECIES: hypothetical protein [Paraburkholderia]|uniref:hypothetical protein n=1 Tax=Paraburkholderia TaxID=1822464 RepID=UPI00224F4DDD|nr:MULTISPECIES: hypothetical protein [Paraburkholderia]MCX4155004.1 hypothetical protein [Paraburkholderia aspalathi]MDN7164414.1 hypothetical protein [Paraburkholderia sp. SECH2]MDQ6392899.1 hypothetical protein [Paraburkholderia aspalathi]